MGISLVKGLEEQRAWRAAAPTTTTTSMASRRPLLEISVVWYVCAVLRMYLINLASCIREAS
jgi:hypothetical protein